MLATLKNGTASQYDWCWNDLKISITYETLGKGSPILLLPALSTVSTRNELAAIANSLSTSFEVTILDWPGFGDSDRPKIDYSPMLYQHFLQDFVREQYNTPIPIVAAGHSAGYALTLSSAQCSQLVLIAPTWKGPLAAMGMPQAIRNGVKDLVQSPLIGQALYQLNTQPGFLKQMYQRHVVIDETMLTFDFIATRHQNTQKPGARYAPAAFVTGNLDPSTTRADILSRVEKFAGPIMILIGEQAPPKSKAEMEAIAALLKVTSITLPGSLGMAEEFGDEIAKIIRPFLLALQ